MNLKSIVRNGIIGLIIGATFVWFCGGFNSSGDNSSNNKTEKTSSCKGNYDYDQGYKMGELTKTMGGTRDPEQFVKNYNYQTGRNLLKATPCFKKGFNDGLDGKESEY